MLIAGVQQTTLLDFPDHVACIIFTAGCNLRCRFCHNPELVLPEKISSTKPFIPVEVFYNFLQERKGLLDGVVICGGEPTVQPDLYDFCSAVKEKGFAVKLDTNGRDPELLQRLIDDHCIDYVAMDIKMDAVGWHALVDSTCSQDPYEYSKNILLSNVIPYEFRTTVIKNYHTREHIERMAISIMGAQRYVLQAYRSGKTLQQGFDGQTYALHEMEHFRDIASAYVEECTIR